VRILIFHGYLLAGTGSNVYNARLASALRSLGHEIHLLCQDRAPERQTFVDAVASWDSGRLEIRALRNPARCTVYRPDIGDLLPVYVLDRYEGVEARRFADCSDAEIAAYVERNVAAVREVAARTSFDLALANHLVMGPAILARGLAGSDVPYAVKVHGSALEYTVKPQPERFLAVAREGLAAARGVLVGSRHTADSLWAALSDDSLSARTRLGPPGVDIDEFKPRQPSAAAAGLRALAARLGSEQADRPGEDAFARDAAAAGRALGTLDPERDILVAYTGKLIVSKGVDLLLAAWPLVLAAEPRARLVIVGFGAYRQTLERLWAALTAADLGAVREIVAAGRELEGGPRTELRLLGAFLDRLEDPAEYLAGAAGTADRVVFCGRLEHAELAELLPACAAQVVPSTFPEAFGMVAAEAAACGALPISADHSGLAEVSRTLAAALPAEAAGWLSFALGEDPVRDLAARLLAWLAAPAPLRREVRAALAATAHERYSWEGVARGVISAAQGRLDELASP
jgi:glycosyltransferase involved in cell wall biosynthesis